jgi:hypothetical protein
MKVLNLQTTPLPFFLLIGELTGSLMQAIGALEESKLYCAKELI